MGGALLEVCIIAMFALIGAWVGVRFFCLWLDRAIYFWQFLAAVAFYGLALMIFVATNVVPQLGVFSGSAAIPNNALLRLLGWAVMIAALLAGFAWQRYYDRWATESRAQRILKQIEAAVLDFGKRGLGYADHLALGRTYEQEQLYDLAAAEYELAELLQPSEAIADRLKAARSRAQASQRDRVAVRFALRVTSRIVELMPHSAAAHLALADLYARSGKREEARQLLQHAASIGASDLVAPRLQALGGAEPPAPAPAQPRL